MLSPITADMRFAADINRLANASEAIAKSLAVIAGLMSQREGRPFLDPCKNLSPNNPNPPSSTPYFQTPNDPTPEPTDEPADFQDPD